MSEAWSREWLVTNGLGGYASGTIGGVAARRYHGLLVAALPSPLGRMMMLNQLGEELALPDGTTLALGHDTLADFALVEGLPVWRFSAHGVEIERRVWMAHAPTRPYVRYRLLAGDGPVRLALVPAVHFRNHDAPVSEPLVEPYTFARVGDHFELRSPDAALPVLKLRVDGRGRALAVEPRPMTQHLYRTEEHRGYPAEGKLISPGVLRVELGRDADATLIASTEPWDAIAAPADALAAELARRARLLDDARAVTPRVDDAFAAELTLAADQFLIAPPGRGDDARTVIAGYHWFTDWGRDTMISLEGLTLVTGRHREAGYILRTFAHYVRDGLIPNMFPDGENEGLYHTADATLWFFHALDRYVDVDRRRDTLRAAAADAASTSSSTICAARASASASIRTTACCARAPRAISSRGWTRRSATGWSRRGAARRSRSTRSGTTRCACSRGWLDERRRRRAAATICAARRPGAARRFNERFWYDDARLPLRRRRRRARRRRPALPAESDLRDLAAASRARRARAGRRCVDVVREQLLTPVGLRSLAPGDPDYKPRYYGDLRARDAAYHQGTVWAWLIGPFVDAWLQGASRRSRRRARVARRLRRPHLDEACVGSDQRDLRRRAAVHAARLHRAGVERGRSAARLAQQRLAQREKVSQASRLPVDMPVLNQRCRSADDPCVNDSGLMRPSISF